MTRTILLLMTRRDWAWLFVTAAIVSLCGTFGVSYVVGEGYPSIPLWAELLISLVLVPVVASIFVLLDVAFAKLEEKSEANPQHRLDRLVPAWSPKSIAIFTLIMIALWAPWYIANFPGAAYWDTYYQIYQVYPENHPIAIIPWRVDGIYDSTLTDAWLVDHHPVVVTMIYGAFGWLSDQLTGNWMAGVALFTAIQGILHCVAFTSSVAYLRRIGCPSALCLACYLFCSLMPFVPTWAMCMVKDSMFGLLYVPYFMMLIETVRTQGRFLCKRSHLIWFVILAVLMCITKKQGVFVVVVTSIVGFVCFWRRRRKGVLPSRARSAHASDPGLSPSKPSRDPARVACKAFVWQVVASLAVVMIAFPFALFPALDIETGGKQEVLGPLFQQTAHYVLDYGDEVTDEEREAIDAVIDYDKLAEAYQFDFEDAVKYRYRLDATTEDLVRYLGVYIQQGLRHPDSYFGAWMGLAGYYVAPTAPINIRMTTVDTFMNVDGGDIERHVLWNPAELDGMRKGLDELYLTVSRCPVINLPLLIVVYTLWTPALLIYVAQRRRIGLSKVVALPGEDAARGRRVKVGGYAWATLLAPQLVLLAFCVIAPVYDARYVIPIFDIAPLLWCGMCVLTLSMHGGLACRSANG